MGICCSFASCGKEDEVYKLGPYVIREDEYRYLMGVYRRNIGISLGYDNVDWGSTNASGMTIGTYVDSMYTSQFTSSLYMLLYSQAIFDNEGLSLTQEDENRIKTNVFTVIAYIANYSEEEFNKIAKEYGFTADTLRSVYAMQLKQQKVQEHLFGANGEKLTDSQINEYYNDKYIRFQTFVVNNTYKAVTNEDGKTEYVVLNEVEKQEKQDLIDDLTNLFAKEEEKKKDYVYKIIDPTLSYEELWKKYSDDQFYPNGCYMSEPNVGQMNASPALTAANLLKENEVARVKAKQYFQQNIPDANINAGDWIEYGYVFVKKLALEEKGYANEANKDFFGEDFKETLVNTLFAKQIADYVENSAFYTLEQNTKIISSYKISEIKPNYLDFDVLRALQNQNNQDKEN
jgi:hypothetical protein